MGLSLSHLYFDSLTGKPNLRFLTLTTSIVAFLYAQAFLFSVATVRDNSMVPYMRKAGGWLFCDTVLYKKFSQPNERLQNKIVAVQDPFKLNHVVFRRVIAEENQWV